VLAAGLSGEAFARLGNSEEQVAALLGKPTKIGKPDSDCVRTNTYESRHYIALVQFAKGHSVAEAYSRKDHAKFSDKELSIFLDGNSAVNNWEKKPGQETGLGKKRP
jgi:hypothetical protein